MIARRNTATMVVAGGTLLLTVQAGTAQFVSGFESPAYNGSAAGVQLNGQNGFYNPNPPASVSANVYSYAGNALGLPMNPTGGDQFVGATGPAGGMFARSQRDVNYGNGSGVWTISFDIAATFVGTLPAAQNVGSFSSQVFPGEATFIALSAWSDPATASNWNADYVWFDAAGSQLVESVPDLNFQNLMSNHWYRWSTTFDLDSNQILEVGVTDLTSGNSATHNPVDRYLFGGAAGAPTPTGFRFFAGSNTVAGNTLGFDNLSIIPAPSVLALLGLAGVAATRRRRP